MSKIRIIMAKKKYALNNSYFKNKRPNDPDTILEIVKYEKENGELPFEYSGDNYVYDAMCERQKRKGVVLQQFLTPDSTAIKMAELALIYISDDKKVLDACCGTGQITRNLIESGFDSENITAFDLDLEMTEVCKLFHPEVSTTHSSFEEFSESKWNLIVSNPPYDIKDLTAFLGWLLKSLTKTGTAVLLLPVGFIDKERPKALVEILSKFNVLHREQMTESFARTSVTAEIVVLEFEDKSETAEEKTMTEQGFPPSTKMDASKFVENLKEENKPNFPNLELKEFYKLAEVKNINVLEVYPSPLNPRKTFDDESLQELAKNISEQGILQPITVRQIDNRYEIVCGERRYRAASIAGLPLIPCIVRNLSDDEAFDVMITENLQRKDVEPMEESRAFIELNKRGTTIEEMAARFGKSQTFIIQRIKLNDLIAEFSKMLDKKELQVSHAFELCKLDQEEQKEIYENHYSPDVQSWNKWNSDTVKGLRSHLENRLNDLEEAEFDKTECINCPHNTSVNSLFKDFEPIQCTKTSCFVRKENESRINESVSRIESGCLFLARSGRELVIVDALKEKGYEPLSIEDFDWYWPVDESQTERYNKQQEDIQNGILKAAWVVGHWEDETLVYVKENKNSTGSSLDDSNVIKELQDKDKRNKEIQKEKTIADLRTFFDKSDYNEKSEPLSEDEQIAMYAAMLINCDYRFREKILGREYDSNKQEKIINIVKESSPEKINTIIRDFIKETCTDSSVTYSKTEQATLTYISETVYPEESKSIIDKHESTYNKRKVNIDKQLEALKEKN